MNTSFHRIGMSLTRIALGFLAAMAVLSSTGSVFAADEIKDTTEKIQWIQASLDEAGKPARTWQYGWTTAYGAMTYLYAGDALTNDESDEKEDRYDAVVNASSSFLGFMGMVIDPLNTWKASEQLKALPEATEEERAIKLRKAEDLLKACAEREIRGRSWTAHALAGLVSLASGIAVASDNSRHSDGFAMFAGGMLVSEIQIFTTPVQATGHWETYRKGMEGGERSSTSAAMFTLLPFPGGLAVSCQF